MTPEEPNLSLLFHKVLKQNKAGESSFSPNLFLKITYLIFLKLVYTVYCDFI